MTSLRRRAIWGGALWAALSAGLGFFALLIYFDRTSAARFDATLAAYHNQATVALARSEGDGEEMNQYLADPAFQLPYSGLYWQALSDGGAISTSRSLVDATLTSDPPATEAASLWEGPGPTGPVRGIAQRVELESGAAWDLRVARSLSDLAAERRLTRQSLAAAFGLVAVLSVAGALLLTGQALAPLGRLRQDVLRRWDSGERLDPEAYPSEVAPLVADINALLDRNRHVIDSARRQAGDLAHALKTPVAVLRNELEQRVRRRDDFAAARDAVARIEAQIVRQLGRVRAENAAAAGYRTDLSDSAARLERLFRRMPGAERVTLAVAVPKGLTVGMDRQDIEEVLGNLLDNAVKWSRREVRLSAEAAEGSVRIRVEDDGPGVPENRRAVALRPGVRLDTMSPGTGLGLAIVVDLVRAYGGTVALGTSTRLKGLEVSLTLPERLGVLETPVAP